MNQLSRIVVSGFRSICECDLELKNLNVLIGPNGAGKSNFIDFFRLIKQLLESNLQLYVSRKGGPDALLHFGRKKTERFSSELYFDNNAYKFALEATNDNRMMFAKESFWQDMRGDWTIGTGHFETKVESQKSQTPIYDYTVPAMRNWVVYHFHDTSDSAMMKQIHGINANDYLRSDGRNLAAFLYFLKQQHFTNYQRIVKTIRMVAPFFDDFKLRPNPENKDQIELEWLERGQDIPFKASFLSDGTLRFICLATVLMQPEQFQPETIIIDEPEIGLHPFAIRLLASLMRSASKNRQIIVATQSVNFLNEFEVEDIIVTDRSDGNTNLHRPDSHLLTSWLEEYSLGELWQKNIFGGRPSR